VQACRLRDSWSDLSTAGLRVFGVSYDRPETNQAFADKHRIPYPLLSDRDRSLARAVGAARRLLPVPKRISYLIGPDGRVLRAYPKVSPATHARQVLSDFLALGGLESEESSPAPAPETTGTDGGTRG
jgi:peroxiredoxin Q/BCP